ncbi:MAG: protease I [Bacteroidales bacterium]
MAKKTAVLVVNPVNGFGLFQYLEAFHENGIPYTTFAVAESAKVKTNSGVCLQTDEVVARLTGRENAYDALVFACGDAMPKFGENAGSPENQNMIAAIKAFGEAGKLMAGHCVGALLFDIAGIAKGRKVALHPYIKNAVKSAVATDEAAVVDGNIYTAQTEHTLGALMPRLLQALK